MTTSKISTKAQTSIPLAVPAAQRPSEGGENACVIDGGQVTIGKAARPEPSGDPFGTFGEWALGADDRAYNGL